MSSRKYLFDHGMYERRNGKLQENSAASQVIFIYIHFQFGGCSQHTHQLQVSTGFPHAQRDLTVEAQRTFKTSCLWSPKVRLKFGSFWCSWIPRTIRCWSGIKRETSKTEFCLLLTSTWRWLLTAQLSGAETDVGSSCGPIFCPACRFQPCCVPWCDLWLFFPIRYGYLNRFLKNRTMLTHHLVIHCIKFGMGPSHLPWTDRCPAWREPFALRDHCNPSANVSGMHLLSEQIQASWGFRLRLDLRFLHMYIHTLLVYTYVHIHICVCVRVRTYDPMIICAYVYVIQKRKYANYWPVKVILRVQWLHIRAKHLPRLHRWWSRQYWFNTVISMLLNPPRDRWCLLFVPHAMMFLYVSRFLHSHVG